MSAPLTITALTKRYAGRAIVRDFSHQMAAGHLTVVCGENGAGKTTLLRCLAGLLLPDAGQVSAPGLRYFLGDADHLYQHATVAENFALATALRPVSTVLQTQIEALWQVAPYRAAVVRTLSRGQRRRVALCRAWLLQPAWLLLDEPFVALDDTAQTLAIHAMAWATQQGCGVVVAVQHVSSLLAPHVYDTIRLPTESA